MTLVEAAIALFIVVVLLASMTPRFMEMRAQAAQDLANDMAGSAAAAMNVNYAGCSLHRHQPKAGSCMATPRCEATTRLPGFALPAGWQIMTAELPPHNGDTGSCTVISPEGYTATYVAIVAGLDAPR